MFQLKEENRETGFCKQPNSTICQLEEIFLEYKDTDRLNEEKVKEVSCKH